ncbi:MAG TPA: lytic transglycosylase domain-containing protein [Chitinophagaceae bacterium]|nr:lytic transglycosylase domain-containing protein [Chitinophagaceae bacterium]
MTKLYIITFSFFLAITCAAQKNIIAEYPGDLSAAPDSNLIINDLKKGFKDLFITANQTGGLNTSQLNPRAVSFVQDYIQRHKKNLEKLKGWGRPYFDLMDAILTSHGIPKEMKYLAVIESHLKTYAVSWAGAVGPWQFMPATARRMGLKVNSNMDERTDYFKSTHAAARYLTELFKIYNDWLLVIAAYNGGPGNVNSAIRRNNSADFWTLQNSLPAESRDHVKKFIATHYIMEGEGGVTTLTKEETKDLLLASAVNPAIKNLSAAELDNSKTQTVSGRYNSVVIASHTLFPITEFNRYNPDFDKLIMNNGNYELRLPADKMEVFVAKRHDILNESIRVLLESFRQSLSGAKK